MDSVGLLALKNPIKTKNAYFYYLANLGPFGPIFDFNNLSLKKSTQIFEIRAQYLTLTT